MAGKRKRRGVAWKPTQARAYQSDAISTDATPRESGGKRKGRRMSHAPRETRVEAIKRERLAELIAAHGSVTVETRKRGRKQYATLVVYVDESRKRCAE